jgi:exopolysaccharide production protein ExoQ
LRFSIIEALLFLGCYATFWVGSSPSQSLQAVILLLLISAAALAITAGKSAAARPSFLEMLLYVIGVVSTVSALCRENDYSELYSGIYLMTLIAVSVIARTIGLRRLLNLATVTIVAGLLTYLLVGWKDLLRALAGTVTDMGLFRFRPEGMFPNLVGLVFGAGSILLARQTILARKVSARAFLGVATAGSLVFVFASSARESILALGVAATYAFALIARRHPAIWRITLVCLGMTAVFVLVIGIGRTAAYFDRILEITSASRGIASGASGRTGLWSLGVSAIFSDPVRLVFGGGLRYSEIGRIGFSTESSYITVLLDSGLLLGALLVGSLCVCIYTNSCEFAKPNANAKDQLAVACLVIFMLIQAIFSRYLLAIGNPMSLIFLLVIVAQGVQANTAGAETFGNLFGSADPHQHD